MQNNSAVYFDGFSLDEANSFARMINDDFPHTSFVTRAAQEFTDISGQVAQSFNRIQSSTSTAVVAQNNWVTHSSTNGSPLFGTRLTTTLSGHPGIEVGWTPARNEISGADGNSKMLSLIHI